MFGKLNPWIRQPTTMIGLALAAASMALTVLGAINGETLVCLLVPALGLVGIDDNTKAAADLRTLATDAAESLAMGHLRENLPRLVKEGVAAALDVVKTGMKYGLALLISTAWLAACAGPPPAATQVRLAQVLAVACPVDGMMQPIAAAIIGALVPEAAAGIRFDALIVHPAIVKYCAALGAGAPALIAPEAAAGIAR